MLLDFLKENKGNRNAILYFDIETLQFNIEKGQQRPSLYKNVTYSVCVGWFVGDNFEYEVFPSFKAFFDKFFKLINENKRTITKSRTRIDMIAHNTNKYDNMFLLHDLSYFFNIERMNLRDNQAVEDYINISMKDSKKVGRETDVALEKRVKSSNNLDLSFYLNGFYFNVTDNFLKTHTSIAVLGKKLRDSGLLTDDDLKTDFDYEIFNRYEDMSDEQAYQYAYECFNNLTDEQLKYIKNDVLILAYSHKYYSTIFPNFDYSKITFSQNILDSYLTNPLSKFQLLNKYFDTFSGKEAKISYTDYTFSHENFYDYIKSFYKGGLNFYNTKYLTTLIKEDCFSIDINSSYPYVMYHEKIPTYLKDYHSFETSKTISIDNLDNRDVYTLYRMEKEVFNREILAHIKSRAVKQLLVKYYNNHTYVNINTNTLRLIRDISGVSINKITVLSYVSFDCYYFGSRDIIANNYFIKTQGKLKNKIDMRTPYDYTITEEENTQTFSSEEVMLSKVVLNGLYGIPALRSHFNLFYLDENKQYTNMINGHKNTERNILFSTFVTSQALYNLLVPLMYLSQSQIDDCFIYCDTDSLYLKSKIREKLPDDLFDPISLGKWDVENEHIQKMYVLNHKKYAYLTEKGITVRCAGVGLDSFCLEQSFENFIKNEFHDGAKIINKKSIFNEQETISIYSSVTYMDKGDYYSTDFNFLDEMKKEMLLEHLKEELKNGVDDALYIESEIGAFSVHDVFKVTHPHRERDDLHLLAMLHDDIK